ncbi:MAG: hypothetical protein KF781_04475 [Chitinophagaceae bacterium]|nr:hypothetical protein [Chitinophagaceae bacterium]MCW5904661.1 hypothetical protein [Chitinophagaceae bacterium]
MKFDGEKYRNIEPIKLSDIQRDFNNNTPSYYPYWWVDGFFDYTDGKITFNSTKPHECYRERKSYLIAKTFKYGFYAFLISFLGTLLYRYGTKTQKWVNENAK